MNSVEKAQEQFDLGELSKNTLNDLSDKEAVNSVDLTNTTQEIGKDIDKQTFLEILNKENFSLDDLQKIQKYLSTGTKSYEDFKPLIDKLPNILSFLDSLTISPDFSIDDAVAINAFLRYLQNNQIINGIIRGDKKISKSFDEIQDRVNNKESVFIQSTYASSLESLRNPVDKKARSLNSLLLNPTIDANTSKITGSKYVTNPSQDYQEKLYELSQKKGISISQLTPFDMESAVLEVYKQDLLDSVELALTVLVQTDVLQSKNINTYKNANIERIVVMLSKQTSGSELFDLCDILLTNLNTQNFSSLKTKFDKKESFYGVTDNSKQVLTILLKNLLQIDAAYGNILKNQDGSTNEAIYIEYDEKTGQPSEAYKNMPGNFSFYGPREIGNKLYQEYLLYKQGLAPRSLRFENDRVYRTYINYNPNGYTRTYITNPLDNESKNIVSDGEKNAKMFFATGITPSSLNFSQYETRLQKHNKTAGESSILEFLNNPDTPLTKIEKEINKLGGIDNVDKIILTDSVFTEYGDLIYQQFGIVVEKGTKDELVLKESVVLESSSFGEQKFYRGDDRPENQKTKELIGNSLSEIQSEISALKENQNVQKNSISIVVSGMASYIPYSGEHGDNEGLAAARARNASSEIEKQWPDMPNDVKILQKFEVDGPAYPPTQEMLSKYFPDGSINEENRETNFDLVEEKIYRDFQKVNISISYNVLDGKDIHKPLLDLTGGNKVNKTYFALDFTNPGTSNKESKLSKTSDNNTVSYKATNEINKNNDF